MLLRTLNLVAKRFKTVLLWLKPVFIRVVAGYIVYILFFAVLLPAFQYRTAADYLIETDPHRFWATEYGVDQVALLNNGEEALGVRLNLIANAEESIDVSYHILRPGLVGDIYFAALLAAADRGVQVRILMDGIFHMLYGSQKDLGYALQLHPQIEYRLYEPLRLIKPWTWNNRLHDKLFIVDRDIAIVSGRNVGDRYFVPPNLSSVVHDFDVVVFTDEPNITGKSAVNQLNQYFDLLWEHDYTEAPQNYLSERRRSRAQSKVDELRVTLSHVREVYPRVFDDDEWLAVERKAHLTYQVSLIHNPIQRGNKAPWVWSELSRLFTSAQSFVLVQSPYFLITKPMLEYLNLEQFEQVETVLLTNSVAASTNLLAIAGYEAGKPSLIEQVSQIWEYQGVGSLHGKAVVIDDELSVVGSFNIDSRSAFLSTEAMLVIHSPSFTWELHQAMENFIYASVPQVDVLGKEECVQMHVPWWKRIIISVLHPVVRLFDYML